MILIRLNLLNQVTVLVHAEKRSVKFTGSSVLIWTTWLFSKFYQKLSSINRFSVRFTQRPVKSTEYEKTKLSWLYCTLSELYRKSVDWTQLLVKFTKKSCCPNKYRTSYKFYWSFFCVWDLIKIFAFRNRSINSFLLHHWKYIKTLKLITKTVWINWNHLYILNDLK